jgi:hypothetical protein
MRTFLMERTNVEPTLHLRGKRLVLEHKNDRVRMTITYAFGAPGGQPSWHQTGSTLEILGQPVNLAQDEEEYVRIFNDGAEPTGPGWVEGGPQSRPTPHHMGHHVVKAVQSGPSRSRRR